MNNTPFLKYNEFTKSIDAPKTFSKAFDLSPWGGLEGFLEASKAGMTGYNNKGSQYRIFVPDVFRATDMTGVAVASLPFDVMDGETVIDSSTNWKNKLGGIPNPQRLMYEVASSLCGGAAYVIPEGTEDVAVNMKYIPPSTISYSFDLGGINQFNYTSQFGGMQTFTPDELIHFYLPDPDMEEQPARAHPLGVATSAAWRSMAMNNTINIQSERGFIPPTLVSAEGLIKTEAEKTEMWFNRWVKNPLREIYKVINANKISIVKVGSGMDELKTIFVELKTDSRIEIAQAFGIPAGIFIPDKAYASEMDVLYRQWYSTSIFTTLYQTIQETWTEQYFKPRYGVRMVYKPETLKVFQEDETKRATAFSAYVKAGVRPSIAGEMLGLDLPQGIEYKDLDEKFDKPEPIPPSLPVPVDGKNPVMPANNEKPKPPAPVKKQTKAIVLSPEAMEDYVLWRNKAIAWGRKGKSAADWENKNLSEEIATPIRAKLALATNEFEIKKAFELQDTEDPQTSEMKELISGLNQVIEQPKQQPIQVLVDNRNYKAPGLTDAFLRSVFDRKD